MAKTTSKRKHEIRAQQKLVKARLRFEIAQSEYVVAQDHGLESVEKTRAKAQKTLTKAQERLDKRAAALARAEEEALSTGSPTARQDALAAASSNGGASPHSPEAAADVVQEIGTGHRAKPSHSDLVVPGGEV